MKRHLLLTLSALSLFGCAESRIQSEPSGEHRVRFACEDGNEVEMRYFPLQGVAILVRHGETVELQQQRSGSGFIYSNGRHTVRGKGDELTIEIGRMAPIKCRSR